MDSTIANTQIGPSSLGLTSPRPDLGSKVDIPETIDASKLTGGNGGVKDVTIPTPKPNTSDALVASLTTGNQNQGLVGSEQLLNEQKTAETAIDTTDKEIRDLMTQLGYKSQDTANLQQAVNLPGLQNTINDLNTQLAQKRAAYDQQFRNIGAQNIPSLFVSGQLALAKAAAATDLGATAAQLQAAQGNLNTAFNTINQTITQKYQPIIEQLAQKKEFYDLNFNRMTNAQQRLATRQAQILDVQKLAITNQQKILGDAASSVNEAIKNGMIDPQTGWAIYADLLSGKETPAEAFNKLGIPAPASVTNTGNITDAITAIESGGSYTATNKSGALGRYQIMPKFWFATIGLDPNSEADKQKFLSTPALQDNLFNIIISTLNEQYNGDPAKVAAAYFGGDPAVKAYGTPAGDKISDGNLTVNQYVNAVLGKMNAAPTGQFADFLKDKSPEQAAYFSSLSPLEQSNVKQILNGEALTSDLITSKGVAGQNLKQKLLAAAQKIDPTFNENTNKIRYNFNKDWNDATTVTGKTKLAINTALNHLSEVSKASQELSPSDLQIINKTKNWWNKQTGSPAITNLQFGLNQLATEIATAYKGGVPSSEEIAAEKEVLGTQFSKSQFQGVFNTAAQFLSGKISSMNYQYKSTMGKYPPEPVIDPNVRNLLIESGIDPSKVSPDPNQKKTGDSEIESLRQKYGY